MKQRIQKLLANIGVASRRHVEQMVRDGRVSVNGRVVRELPVLVDPDSDRLEVDGEPVRLGKALSARRRYYLLNKPKGVYCTNVAQGEQVRAVDLLPRDLQARLYPVGRLDAASCGLLLLTDDGELTHRLTHPRYGIERTYRAAVDGCVSPETVARLQEGVHLADRKGGSFRTGRARIHIVRRDRQRTILEITLCEGRNREVRRMLAKLGHKVRQLLRIRMGPLTITGLPSGACRPLIPREISALRRAVGLEMPAADRPAPPGA